MKIVILTLPLNLNYGGILQCYALQTVLERMGHKVQVLTRPLYGNLYYIVYPMAVCKRLFKRFILGKKVTIFKTPYQIVRLQIDRFIHKYIHQNQVTLYLSFLIWIFIYFQILSPIKTP